MNSVQNRRTGVPPVNCYALTWNLFSPVASYCQL